MHPIKNEVRSTRFECLWSIKPQTHGLEQFRCKRYQDWLAPAAAALATGSSTIDYVGQAEIAKRRHDLCNTVDMVGTSVAVKLNVGVCCGTKGWGGGLG